jgi:hypothetical protein
MPCLHGEHVHGRAEEHLAVTVVIALYQPVQEPDLTPLFGKVGIDADLLGLLHVPALIAVQHKGIVAVETVVMPARVLGAFKAVLQVAVPDAAWDSRTGDRAEAVLETPVATALKAESAQSAVESAQRE